MNLAALMRRARRSVLVQNAAALYAVQGASLLIPILTLPYLARVLRPEVWGLVVFGQAFTAWSVLVMHYGFSFSATRLVAQARDEPGRIAGIVAGVQGAKFVLGLAVLLGGAAAGALVPVFRTHPEYLVLALVAAVLQGFTPYWYFQGMERMRGPALLDVAARVVAAAGIFLWVRTPADGWKVLALQAGVGLVPAGFATVWMYREVPLRLPALSAAVAMLRQGWPLFVFVGAASVYGTANSLLLGLMAVPMVVAFYGAAERIVRAVLGLLAPLSQALYPRISHRVANDPSHAGQMVRRSLLPIAGIGVAMGGTLALSAPLLVKLALGPGYEPVVQVLRILAFLPPLIALGTVLGLHWALPLGLNREYNHLVLAAGATNVLLAVLLVPRFGAMGMALSAVLAEALVECGLVVLFLRRLGREGDLPMQASASGGD